MAKFMRCWEKLRNKLPGAPTNKIENLLVPLKFVICVIAKAETEELTGSGLSAGSGEAWV